MRDKKDLFKSIWEMPYGISHSFRLFDAAKNNREFVQKLQLQRKIPVHNGCVNSICWNETGRYLLSGSDDQHLSVVDGYNYAVLAYVYTGHRANIFSAKFLPNRGDTQVISCSGDGIIIYSDLERSETSFNNKFNCHKGTAYDILTVPSDSNTFLSCGEDRTVRWFDVRTKTSCVKDDCKDDILIHCQSPVTSLAVNPLTPYQLAVGCADASVRLFDRRMLSTDSSSGFCASNGFQALMSCFTVPEFTQSKRITSLCYSADGQEMLVSYSSDYIYLFDIKDDLEKKPRLLSNSEGSSNDSDTESGLFFRGRPLMKRLRIRGDWSDTGPNARPESESRAETEEPESQSRTSIVRTMTDILTRMLSNNQNRTEQNNRSEVSSSSSSSTSEEEPSSNNTSARTKESHIRKKEKRREASTDSPASKHKCAKKTDPNQPSTSCALKDRATPDDHLLDPVPGPSTSCDADNFGEDKSACSGKTEQEDTTDGLDDENEAQTVDVVNVVDDLDESIEVRLEARRRDLLEKHNVEPMVNLHYSGESVNSGQITLNVATSSTVNERQWLEQYGYAGGTSVPDLEPVLEDSQDRVLETPPIPVPGSERDVATPEHPSFESDNESGLQSIQPNQDLLPLISNIGSMNDSNSNSNQADSSEDPEEEEVELMMEVDSWEVDSDSDQVSGEMSRPRPSRRRNRRDRISEAFMDSLNDKVKAANDELKKVEGHMQKVNQPRVKKKFTGHRNARTMIKEATFWGDNFVMSGSDCGHIFIWDRHSTELIMIMEADHHVVNCLQPHPFDPILASSGIDYDIKLWAPTREEPFFDIEKASEIIKRNEVMLEETKDTITVPASFMFRMFTTLNHFRTGHAFRWTRAAREMRAQRESESGRR